MASVEEQIARLEAASSRGKLRWFALQVTLWSWKQQSRDDDLLLLLDRLLAIGYDEPRFLRYGFEMLRDRRDFVGAQRFAEAWAYGSKADEDARYELAWITWMLGEYRIAASFCTEQLDAYPDDLRTKQLLARCYLRLGAHRDALAMMRASGGGAREEWLAEIVEKGRRPRNAQWMGRIARAPRRMAQMEWKKKVLAAPLSVRTASWDEIDRFINSCVYESDQRLWGEADAWIVPSQFEEIQRGDCEDFALWTWVQLLRQGVNARFVVGAFSGWELNHAWVQIYRNNQVSVVECTPVGVNRAIGAVYAREYAPMISVDRTLTWYEH